MKKLTILLVTILLGVGSFAQHHNHAVIQDADPPSTNIKITAVPNLSGDAVLISYSSNAWSTVSTIDLNPHGAVMRANANRGDFTGFVAGDANVRTIQYTTDFWSTDGRSAQGADNGQSIYISGDQNWMCVPERDDWEILFTDDQWTTWDTIQSKRITGGSSNYLFTSCAISYTADTVVVGTASATELYYSHGGMRGQWYTTSLSTNEYVEHVAMATDGSYIFIGFDGATSNEIGISTDGGVSFSKQSISATNGATHVACSDDGKYVLAWVNNNTLWVNNNYGASGSWTQTLSSKSGVYMAKGMSVSESGRYMTVGDDTSANDFYYSNDYGVTWTTREISGNTATIKVVCVSEN